MFDFLDNPVFEVVVYGGVGLMLLFFAKYEWPQKINEDTGEIRTHKERWKLASRGLKVDVLFGIVGVTMAFISILEAVGILKVVGP